MNNYIKEYMDKYKKYVDIEQIYISKYDEKSILEIMARVLAFWYLQKIEYVSKFLFTNNLELQERYFYLEKNYYDTLEDIIIKFNNNKQKIIFDRCEILKKERHEAI